MAGPGPGADGAVLGEAQAFEARYARNGRGAPSGDVPPLKAQSGQTGKGDAAPLVLPGQTLGQGEANPVAPGENGWRGDPAMETYVRADDTQALTSRFGTTGADYPDAEAGWLVAGQQGALGQDEAGSLGSMGTTGGHRLDLDSAGAYVAAPDPAGQEVAPTLKANGGRDSTGKAGNRQDQHPMVLDRAPDEAVGFYSTESHSSGNNDNISPTLKVGSGAGIPSPPAVYSKRHAASDAEDAETWDESQQAHTLNQNMNAPDVAADAQAVRRLTPTEAERLQGLPDGWTHPHGPSLADAPAWHDLRNPPIPVRAVTINEGNDRPEGSVWESEECGSLTSGGGKPGQGYHAVRTEPLDPTWIGLDNANRGDDHVKEGEQHSEALRAKATLDQAVSVTVFHADAVGRDGEAKTDSPDAEGRMRKRDAGAGIAEDESYSLTTGQPHAIGFYPNNNEQAYSDGAREGESPTLAGGGGGNTPAVAYNVSGGGGETADLRASETDSADCLSTRGGWAYTQGGTLIDESAEHLDAIQGEAGVYDSANAMRGTDPGTAPTLKSGGERQGKREGTSGLAGDTVPVVAFEPRYYSDRDRMGGAPSELAGPVKATDWKEGDASQAVVFEPRYYNREHESGGPGTPPSESIVPPLKAQSGQGDGAPHVAFAQNQREEVRELDAASSLSGQGTHQTTYVSEAGAPQVAHSLTAEGFDASEDGTGRGTPLVAGGAPPPRGANAPYDPQPDGPRYAALGDAVTSPVARWIGERLIDVLRERGVVTPDGVDLEADLR